MFLHPLSILFRQLPIGIGIQLFKKFIFHLITKKVCV